jgi:hypothetical protein
MQASVIRHPLHHTCPQTIKENVRTLLMNTLRRSCGGARPARTWFTTSPPYCTTSILLPILRCQVWDGHRLRARASKRTVSLKHRLILCAAWLILVTGVQAQNDVHQQSQMMSDIARVSSATLCRTCTYTAILSAMGSGSV